MLRNTTALTAVENKIPNVSNLVNKTNYNTKISENENKFTTDHNYDKYITTQEFNKLTAKKFYYKICTRKFNKQKSYWYFRKKERF